jgi:uncharacterized membrane protein YvbJ
MQCRNCGTEIADKAIVCYRCGTATTDPVRKAVPIKRRSPLPSLIAAAILILIGLVLGYTSTTATDPDRMRTLAGVVAGAGVIVLILALIRRR